MYDMMLYISLLDRASDLPFPQTIITTTILVFQRAISLSSPFPHPQLDSLLLLCLCDYCIQIHLFHQDDRLAICSLLLRMISISSSQDCVNCQLEALCGCALDGKCF